MPFPFTIAWTLLVTLQVSSANIFLKLQNNKDSVYAVQMQLQHRAPCEEETKASLTSDINLRLGRNTTELVGYILNFNDKDNAYFRLSDAAKVDLGNPFVVEIGLDDLPTYGFHSYDDQHAADIKLTVASKLLHHPKELKWRVQRMNTAFQLDIDVDEITLKGCKSNVTFQNTKNEHKIHIDVNVLDCSKSGDQVFGSNSSYAIDLVYTRPAFELINYNSRIVLVQLNSLTRQRLSQL